MTQHVELQRRFLEVDEAKDSEATALESYIASISGADTGIGWTEIFAAKESVVILGEPGSGKTNEMQAQMARLRQQGACAALFELGHVVSTSTPPMSHDDSAALAPWRDNKADAWLFLDAVDESKLVRISEWRSSTDKDLVVSELDLQKPTN